MALYKNSKNEVSESADTLDGASDVPCAGEMEPSTLYRIIREKITSEDFETFAIAIGDFNSGKKTAEETLANISKLLDDKVLLFHMNSLINSATSESN